MTAADADRLAEEHLYLISKLMVQTRSRWRGIQSSDIRSAAFEGLASAVATWDQKKTPFSPWASAKIRWAILEAARGEYRQRGRDRTAALQIVKSQQIRIKIEPRRLSEQVSDPAFICQDRNCRHPWFMHHPAMGCMYWDRRLPGSGWCKCDGFCSAIPIAQREAL